MSMMTIGMSAVVARLGGEILLRKNFGHWINGYRLEVCREIFGVIRRKGLALVHLGTSVDERVAWASPGAPGPVGDTTDTRGESRRAETHDTQPNGRMANPEPLTTTSATGGGRYEETDNSYATQIDHVSQGKPPRRETRAADPVDVVRKLRAKLEDDRHRRARRAGWSRRFIATGLQSLDAVLPNGGLPCGAVTEILSDESRDGSMALAMRIASSIAACEKAVPVLAPLLYKEGPGEVLSGPKNPPQSPLAKGGSKKDDLGNGGRKHDDLSGSGTSVYQGNQNHRLETTTTRREAGVTQNRCIVLIDTFGDFYPPGACRYGIALNRLIVIRPGDRKEAFWATEQSLRCSATTTVIALLDNLDEQHSRRLQVAAESSGCVGLILRTTGRSEKSFAAVRLLVEGVCNLNSNPEFDVDRTNQSEFSPPSTWSIASGGTPCDSPGSGQSSHLYRITLLKVREGMPAKPVVVDMHHETGALPIHPAPVDRPTAKRA